MALEPVVFQVNVPNVPVPIPPVKPPKLPWLHVKWTKILTAGAAVVISLSMVSFGVFSILSNNKGFKKSHGLNINPQDQLEQANGSTVSDAALPGGGIAKGVGGTTGTNSPVVSITADPASVNTGKTSHLKWTVTNNPESCTASDDWNGTKASSGNEDTQVLTTVQTYLFTLTCKTATGTGFATVSVGATAQGGTGAVATRPGVTLAADPTAIYTNDSSTLTWSVSNNPTSCTASGDWSGLKSVNGPASTGQLATAKTYTYTLTCINSAGSGYSTATVQVKNPPPGFPITQISSDPVSPVTPGTSVKLTWSATNNPKCTASDDWSGTLPSSGSQTVGPLNTINKTYYFSLTCSNETGSTFDQAIIGVLRDPPVVTLTVSPSSMYVGSSATISWTVSNTQTNSADSCTSTGDWPTNGSKTKTGGSQSTGTLNTAKTYIYSLSCTNEGGTSLQNVDSNNVAHAASLNVTLPPAPTVSLTANPISITSGGSSTLTWTTGNNPTSCSSSGDWPAGSKSVNGGTQSTGTLSTVKTYSYTIQCNNLGGTASSSATVTVTSSGGTVVNPAITIQVNPSTIGAGGSNTSTLNWSTTGNPTSCTASGGAWSGAQNASGTMNTGVKTAGTYTYTLMCSNSAGSDTKSAVLTVINLPAITINVSPSSINTGSSATITWSVTNSPTSCSGGGGVFSGSKAFSGSQTTGAMNTAGTYALSLSCTNSGGTSTGQTTLTVTNPGPTYCAGKTPCYGLSEMANPPTPAPPKPNTAASRCWGWNEPPGGWAAGKEVWVINLSGFSHPGGQSAGSLKVDNVTCNRNIYSFLTGSAITGFKDKDGKTTHGHNSSTNNNTSGSGISSAKVGYYDATKP